MCTLNIHNKLWIGKTHDHCNRKNKKHPNIYSNHIGYNISWSRYCLRGWPRTVIHSSWCRTRCPARYRVPLSLKSSFTMIFKYFRSAILAGFGAGIIASMLHLAFVQPLLLEAELYESGTLMHGQQTDLQSNEVASSNDHDHDHDHSSNLISCLLYTSPSPRD